MELWRIIVLIIGIPIIILKIKNKINRRFSRTSKKTAGYLAVTSGAILVSDPMYLSGENGFIRIGGINPGKYPVIISVLMEGKDEKSAREVFCYKVILLLEDVRTKERKKLGEICVDSATACFVDEDVFKKFYKEIWRIELHGKNHELVAKKIKELYGLDYNIKTSKSSYIVGDITEELQDKIFKLENDYSKVHIGSIDTINQFWESFPESQVSHDFIFDHESKLNMIGFSTGGADGTYELYGYFKDDKLVKLELEF